MKAVVLAGGTGGAKLARGLLDVLGDGLTVVANTGDDVEVHGAHVSPDPDLCTFQLADRIDGRGWGVADDTFSVMDALSGLGEDVWFSLGDFDLAVCLQRARRLAEGWTPTACQLALCRALGVPADVLPMSDAPVRTRITTAGREVGLQEFLIRERGAAPIEDVRFEGIQDAAPTPQVLAAVADADAILIGPSNPVISIGPILALPGMRAALGAARAPVVAVSPIVGGAVLKGPTAAFMAWSGHSVDADGIVATYHGVIDGIVADERCGDAVVALQAPTLLDTPEHRREAAARVLTFAAGLAK